MLLLQGRIREQNMPLIQVDMFEGRTDDQIQEYVQALTDSTCRLLGCIPEDVNIIVRDVPRSRWSTGGTLWTRRPVV